MRKVQDAEKGSFVMNKNKMPTEELKREAEELQRQLTYHAERYYVYDSPEISDYDYDMMYASLLSI